MENPIMLGGHCGSGLDVVSSGFNYHIRYGFIRRGVMKEPDFQISNIGKEDMVKLATLLLAVVGED